MSGERELARERLGVLLDGEAYVALLEAEPAVALRGLATLDDAAASLGLVDVQAEVRAKRVELLAEDHGPEDRELLLARLRLGIALYDGGRLEQAHAEFEAVHAAWERLLEPDDSYLLAAKTNLANTRAQRGDLAGALALREQVLAIDERTREADDPALLLSKLNLAGTLVQLGEPERARALQEEVLAARRKALPPDDHAVLAAEEDLAWTLSLTGDLAGALALFEHVAAAREAQLPADHPVLLSSLGNLATVRLKLGDAPGAIELLERVLAGEERVLPADHPHLVATRSNLAMALRVAGDDAGALALAEQVHAAHERTLPADHPDRIASQLNLAALLKTSGDVAGARELEEDGLERRARLLPPGHPQLLDAETNLAITRALLGDREGALELLEDVRAWRVKQLPPEHPLRLDAEQNLAFVRCDAGDLEGARAAAGELLTLELGRALQLQTAAPRVARAAAVHELWRLGRALSLAEATAGVAARSLDAQLFGVLETLREVSTSSAALVVAASRHPELEELRERLARARAALQEQAGAVPEETGALEPWRRELVDLAEQRDALERDLRRRLVQEGVAAPPIDAAGVAERLAVDEAVVGFLSTTRTVIREGGYALRAPTEEVLLAFVVTHGGEVRCVELGPAAEIEELCTQWREKLGAPIVRGVPIGQERDGETDGEAELEAGRALRARVLDPCLAAVGETPPRALRVVLDDFLHLIPLDALPWTDERRVGDVLAVHTEVSLRRFVAPPPAADRTGALVALGDVDFGPLSARDAGGAEPPGDRSEGDDRSTGARPASFARLLQSRFEVEALGVLFREAFETEPVVLTGVAAT